MEINVSLRYAASLHLHELDKSVTLYSRTRFDLLLALDKLNTVQIQLSAMQKRFDMLAKKSTSPSESFGRSITQILERKHDAVRDVERALQTMSNISESTSALHVNMCATIGNIDADSFIQAYSHRVNSDVFNDEYREWQRAIDQVGVQARQMSADVKVKVMQFKHCPETQYTKLHKTWSSNSTTADDEMDALAAMMLS